MMTVVDDLVCQTQTNTNMKCVDGICLQSFAADDRLQARQDSESISSNRMGKQSLQKSVSMSPSNPVQVLNFY